MQYQLDKLSEKLNKFYRYNNLLCGLIFANNEAIGKVTGISSHKIGYIRTSGYSNDEILTKLETFLVERNSRIYETMNIDDMKYIFETIHARIFITDKSFPISLNYQYFHDILHERYMLKEQVSQKIVRKLLWVKSRFLIIPQNES